MMLKFVAILLSVFFSSAYVHAQATPWVDLNIKNGHILIPTKIGGVEGYSVLDTGAHVSMMNSRFRKKHNLEYKNGRQIQMRGVNGTSMRASFVDVPVELLGTEMTFKFVADLDWSNDEMQMLIGADFLSLLVFQFDYPNQRMRAISRDAIDMKKLSNVESRLDKLARMPIVKVNLNDEVDVWLIADTGNSMGLVLKRPVATRRDWLDVYDAKPIETRGAFKQRGMEFFRLPMLSIGPYNVKNAGVAVPEKGQKFEILRTNSSSFAGGRKTKSQGLIGYDVFKNFLVTIDYKTGAMHLEIPQKPES